MTKIPPRPSRPSAIRRRPQTSQSVDEFIQAGTGEAPPVEVASVAAAPGEIQTSTEESSAVAGTADVNVATATELEPVILEKKLKKQGNGKTYFSLFLGLCALGVALFDAYRLTLLDPFFQGLLPWVPIPVVEEKVAPPPVATPPPLVAAQPPAVIQAAAPPSPPTPAVPVTPVSATPSAESPSIAQPPSGVQGVQWQALTDLQFARHDLLLGLNTSAQASLVLAKVHLDLLGKPFSAESTALDRILSRLQTTPVLVLGQLDHDIEALKEVWWQITFGSGVPTKDGKGDWLPWHRSGHPGDRAELETTNEGRALVARLDRLKWLALWGDEAGLRQAAATLDTVLGSDFLDSPDAKPWLLWVRGLQRIPLRHDVTDLNTLIVRLSRVELPP